MSRKLKVGVAGLGRGFSVMLPTFARDQRIALVAAADSRADARAKFAADFAGNTYESVEALCSDPDVEVVYVATPHQLHAKHAKLAASAGKHLLVEKPMAISITECQEMIAEARNAGVRLVVGHSHSFDGPYLRMRELIGSGQFGRVRMITAINYTDFVYRPRRPEEFDTAQGGGAIFSQGAHQVDIVRLLAGCPAKSIRAITASWDDARPMDGAYAALLTFDNGAAATLNYSGYGRFDSDEWQNWVGEMGYKKSPRATERKTFATADDETSFKQSRNYGGANFRMAESSPEAHQSFGPVIVSCERADLRPMPNGVMIYCDGEARLDPLPAPQVPRVEVINELYDAIVNRVPPLHNGEWAMATLEICLAMLRSSRESCVIELRYQG